MRPHEFGLIPAGGWAMSDFSQSTVSNLLLRALPPEAFDILKPLCSASISL
jgi:hypothetical protein